MGKVVIETLSKFHRCVLRTVSYVELTFGSAEHGIPILKILIFSILSLMANTVFALTGCNNCSISLVYAGLFDYGKHHSKNQIVYITYVYIRLL